MIRALLPSRTSELLKKLANRAALVTTPGKIDELKRWLPVLSYKKGLDLELLLEGLSILPVEVLPETAFKHSLNTARRQIAHRDPTDADLLALALAEDIPIWTDDRDFQDSTARIMTTAQIIAHLENNT
jgi:predicted nucleic acid-binding protein